MRNIFIALLMLSGTVVAGEHLCNIVPENDLYISVNAKVNNGMTEEKFNESIDRAEAIYGPIIKKRGKKLEVVRKWDDGTVNAYAQQTGDTWKVSMFGGLARHDAITQDAFALVVCHELGHHLGGLPKKSSWMGGLTWASNEGQSDYFGSSKCFRKYAEKEDNVSLVKGMDIPELVVKKCKANFSTEEDIAICKRGSMAGLSLGNLFRALRRTDTPLKFSTPDPSVVSRTNHNHPAAQCRLDTYFAGAICSVSAYDDVNDDDATVGTCTRSEGHTDGVRPLCWYKP